jgi:hypothetical protein
MSKLRINDIHDDMSPRELRRLLEPFGEVREISIHAGGNLVYALAEMDHDEAVAMIDAIDDAAWEARMGRGRPSNSRQRWPTTPDSQGFLTLRIRSNTRKKH